MTILALGKDKVSLDAVIDVAFGRRTVSIDPDARRRIVSIREKIEGYLDDDAPNVYGVNTGFGALAEVRINAADLRVLQRNLIRSHATGVGIPYSERVTRAVMLLRASVLMVGTSGVRPAVPELLVAMLNSEIHPVIPEKGSVGASGDLAPLAHLALVLIGEGEAFYQGERIEGGLALQRAGLTPVVLEAKEGLALINGTQAMTADAALVLERAFNLLKVADIAGAASVQALLGSRTPFDPRIQAVRGHVGQLAVAANLLALTDASQVIDSHRDCEKVQDPYSLRCIPQVHGASRDVVSHVAEVVSRECQAATDNPLVFVRDDGELDLLSGGNFHGQPVALAADYLGMGLAELANISERRIEQLVNPALSSGLPPFLAPDSGLNSGFMIAQVTAAALVSENKILAHPASVDSIPSSANREDHVSMGTIAARKARNIAEHVEYVLAIELLCAAQGMHLRRPLKASVGVEAAITCIREVVPPLAEDRNINPDINAIAELIRSGLLVQRVEDASSPIN
jgi:histidine ammonia-lyase